MAPLELHALDADMGENARVSMQILSGDSERLFELVETAPGSALLRPMKPLDRFDPMRSIDLIDLIDRSI